MADEDQPTPDSTPANAPTPPAGGGGAGGDGQGGRRPPDNTGIPIDAWITAPLLAAARSNMVLAENTLDYVKRLAYMDPDDPSSGPRLLKFTLDRKYKKPDGPGFGSE